MSQFTYRDINMIQTLENMLNRLNNNTIGFILGSIGSGKTFLSFLIAHILSYRKGYEVYYYNGGICGSECLDIFIEECRSSNEKKVMAIFDDFSFSVRPNSKEYYSFLNKVFRIRHLAGVDSIFLIFIGHYLRSLSPFIRSTNYKILTSITSSEIRMYANDYLFKESDLWDFYEYYVKIPDRFLILLEFRGVSKIIDVTVEDEELKKQIFELMREKTSRQYTETRNIERETDREVKEIEIPPIKIRDIEPTDSLEGYTTIKVSRSVRNKIMDLKRKYGFKNVNEFLESILNSLEGSEKTDPRIPIPQV